uniref:hypothetical protein n=1 Tax=Gracilaria urvillei TaxID=172974 RepID=UPI001D12588D|nr:hypothetical protein LK147_pgp137 [Hydropuntia urvillei]UAD88403.1 hypothetical protein [Hydropuntia urvillei]
MYYINPNLYSSLFTQNIFSFKYEPNIPAVHQHLVSRKLIGRLINKYWQEKIFLSVPSTQSEKYINQLKLEGVLIYKAEQKKFLLDFSKALLSGRIQTSLDCIKLTSNNNQYISYIWKKGCNFPIPIKFSFFSSNTLFLNKEQLIFFNMLYKQPFPLFAVTNSSNRIILADSSEDIKANLKLIDKIYKWYYNKFVIYKNLPPSYYGLFFVNPRDAKEYMDSIKIIYKLSNTNIKNQLNLFSTHLSTYYKLTRLNFQSLQIRLIPDLEEISKLIHLYKNYRNIKFHKYQKYGRKFFQGQPIYTIEPFLAYNKKTNKVKLLNYSYLTNNYNSSSNKVIFTNYSTLLKAWQIFKKQNVDYKLSNQPKVLVYNLEDFIKTYEFNYVMKTKNVLFIPSEESYRFVKYYPFIKNQNKIKRIFSNKFLDFQILSQRIIWSLTSRQPINW